MAVVHQLVTGAIDKNDLKASIAEITFTTPYVTGGDALTPSHYGMSSILFVVAEAPFGTSTYSAAWNPSTGKVQLFGSGSAHWASLDEVQNATAIGSVTARLFIIGKP